MNTKRLRFEREVIGERVRNKIALQAEEAAPGRARRARHRSKRYRRQQRRFPAGPRGPRVFRPRGPRVFLSLLVFGIVLKHLADSKSLFALQVFCARSS
jgi:hypothetical protein